MIDTLFARFEGAYSKIRFARTGLTCLMTRSGVIPRAPHQSPPAANTTAVCEPRYPSPPVSNTRFTQDPLKPSTSSQLHAR